MDQIHDLEALLHYHIQKLNNAEDQQLKAIPGIIALATHKSLRNALQHHYNLTEQHKKRLEKISRLLKKPVSTQDETDEERNVNSKGIKGLIEEARLLLNAKLDNKVIDSAIIACVQEMEHYEICSYGTALAYARQMGLHDIEQLLQETLSEEYDADELLTALAISSYNKQAGPVADEKDVTTETPSFDTTENSSRNTKVSISERNITSPGGRAGTSHRGYPNGESRGH